MINRTVLFGDDGNEIATVIAIESPVCVVDRVVRGNSASADFFRNAKNLSPDKFTVIARYAGVSATVLLTKPDQTIETEIANGLLETLP